MGGGIGIDCMSLVCISKPLVLHPQEEGMSLSVFTITEFVPFFVPVGFEPILEPLSLLQLSCVAVSRPDRLSELNRVSLEPDMNFLQQF